MYAKELRISADLSRQETRQAFRISDTSRKLRLHPYYLLSNYKSIERRPILVCHDCIYPFGCGK
jgi:hypothetical protein